MKKVNSVFVIIVILILIFTIAGLWATLSDNYYNYKQREEILKAQLDSVKALQHQADLHAIQVMTELQTAKSDLAYQSKITEKIKLRYEALRSIKPVNLSDAQIDSAIARLYPIR